MPQIIQKPIGRECSFINQLYTPLWFVVHFTGGTPNLQSLYNYWVSQCGVGSNSHFGIERSDNAYAKAGDIWQFLDYTQDGACANCCLENGYAPFLPTGVNLNVRTISVECINPDAGNNGAMPQAQLDSLVYLIQKVCSDMNIPTNRITGYWNGYEDSVTWGDASGGIIMHRDIAPINRRMCPGTPYYNGQMQQVINLVNGGTNVATFIPPDRNGWAIRHWQQYYEYTAQLPQCPQRDTGIFNVWRDLLFNQNIDMGAVVTPEKDNGDYKEQNFTAGTIFWHKTQHNWHATTGAGPRAS